MKTLIIFFSFILMIAQQAEASISKISNIDVHNVEKGAENCSTGPIKDGTD